MNCDTGRVARDVEGHGTRQVDVPFQARAHMLILLPAALLHEPGEVRLGGRSPLARAFSRADERRELGGFDVLDVAERPQH